MSAFIPAERGYGALYRKRGGGFKRRTVIGWKISDNCHARAHPVTLADSERMQLPVAVIFPDRHVESLDGVRARRDLISFRKALDREASVGGYADV